MGDELVGTSGQLQEQEAESMSIEATTTTTRLDELVDGGDLLACDRCVAARGECEYHRGWAAGWDACTAFVARVVEKQRTAEDGDGRHEGSGV